MEGYGTAQRPRNISEERRQSQRSIISDPSGCPTVRKDLWNNGYIYDKCPMINAQWAELYH